MIDFSINILTVFLNLIWAHWASSFMAKLARPGNKEKRKLSHPGHNSVGRTIAMMVMG